MGKGCGVGSVPNVGTPKIVEEKGVRAGAKSGTPDPFAISEYYTTPVDEPSPNHFLLTQPCKSPDGEYLGPRKQAYHSKAKSVKCVDLLNSLKDKFEGTMMIPEAHGKEVVDALTQACNEAGAKWFDPQFPPHDLCLNRHPSMGTQVANQGVWRRFSEIRDDPVMAVDGTGYGDVVQGAMGNCYMIGGICGAAGDPNYIERNICPPKINDAEVYAVRLCKGTSWVWVLLDDFLPATLESGSLYFCHSKSRNEFWPCLVGKACAKLAGAYQCLDAKVSNLSFTSFPETSHVLGGGRILSISPKLGKPELNAEALWKVIQAAGPKGAVEWQGAWSDKSKIWDEYPDHKHLRVEKDDGIFYMPLIAKNKKGFLRLFKFITLIIPEHAETEGDQFVAELREAYEDKWGSDMRDRNWIPHFDPPFVDSRFSFAQWIEGESCRFYLGGNPFGGAIEINIAGIRKNDAPTKHSYLHLHNNWQLGIENTGSEPEIFYASGGLEICFFPTSKTPDGKGVRRRFVYDDNLADGKFVLPKYNFSNQVKLDPGAYVLHVSDYKPEIGEAGKVVKMKPGAQIKILDEVPASVGFVEVSAEYEEATEEGEPSQWRLTVSEDTEVTLCPYREIFGGEEGDSEYAEYWVWLRFNVSEKKEYDWGAFDWEYGWVGEGFDSEDWLKSSEGGMLQ
eukprot:Cvel_31376.t1-p1 / transcript=Cvel_31376.t1 / gene=Cvel_31376 / organism=Chromera_velia_CCMP2878 / gene_product=Calpain-1 catalytic subunit, putative / transcript_product=Calpain-1 catalytic subunit, putative / location=Cvel_scaffold4664:3926-8103(+) / protein_length=675 / sequence_SO=supercontig / SO=protein_coding / is_pseudo=false